jgi:hypothetical protein
MTILIILFLGSLVKMIADFLMGPEYPLSLTAMVIFPSPPGGMVRSNRALAQPQSVWTVFISKTPVPVFLTVKTWATSSPLASFPNLKTCWSTEAEGVP